MPSMSLSEWQQYKKRRASEETKPVATPKKEWQWDVEVMEGYDGVDTFGDEIIWFSKPLNPHAGEVASSQSFEDFLENGLRHLKPPNDQMLDELYDAVKTLFRMK